VVSCCDHGGISIADQRFLRDSPHGAELSDSFQNLILLSPSQASCRRFLARLSRCSPSPLARPEKMLLNIHSLPGATRYIVPRGPVRELAFETEHKRVAPSL
jgi:hypothetical protein